MKEAEFIQPGQTVCVVGLGVTGRSAVRYCLARGARVLVSDSRDEKQFLAGEGDFLEETRVEWEAGGNSYNFCSKSQILLPSPGIDLRNELFVALRNSDVIVAGELAVVSAELNVPVIAVTGTNGKTTVTSLIGDVLEKSGKRVFVGGNIGTPLYEYCLSESEYDVVVVEVSSFQLEKSGAFAPDIGVLLNITPDHLDRHGTIESYREAKGRLFCNQVRGNIAVVNGDDAECGCLKFPEGVDVLTFGRKNYNSLKISKTSFLVENDQGLEEFRHGLNGDDGFTSYNFAAAYAALKKYGLTDSEIAGGFSQFNGLPHRLEFVAKKDGVIFINDSKATNTGAVVGALEEMTNGVVLIAGGKGKGEDYTVLRKSIEQKVHTLVLIGEEARRMSEGLGDLAQCRMAATMEEAVTIAYQAAKSGDAVLLSPACASFDMFGSYGNRGDVFKHAVQELSE